MAAFMLASAAPYFPQGTVHLAVVDPGVGSQRRAILIQTEKGFFVGPDNGILVLAAQNQGIEHIYHLTNPKFMLHKISSTFHGRDIFAPAAAHLDKGVLPTGFGNIITNINETDMVQNHAKLVKVELPDISLKLTFGKTYAEAKPKELIALIGSHGFLEIALNQGNAAEKFHVKTGDKIVVTAA